MGRAFDPGEIRALNMVAAVRRALRSGLATRYPRLGLEGSPDPTPTRASRARARARARARPLTLSHSHTSPFGSCSPRRRWPRDSPTAGEQGVLGDGVQEPIRVRGLG